MTILLNNVNTDVTDPPAADIFVSQGGPGLIHVRANDFGGATVEVQTSSTEDSLTRWATLTSGTFTGDSTVKTDYLPSGVSLRAIVTGTTGSSDGIFVDILQ